MKELPAEKKKFAVPENYFETLPDRTWERIALQPDQVGSTRKKPVIIRLLLPLAAVAAVLLLLVIFRNNRITSELNNIPETQAYNYLEDNIDDLEIQQLIEAGEIALSVESIATVHSDSTSYHDSLNN